jgi:hypothetical protein
MADRDKTDEYQELAGAARRNAERATDADDRSSWLGVAAAWMRLIALMQPQPQLQQQPQQQLESDADDPGEPPKSDPQK